MKRLLRWLPLMIVLLGLLGLGLMASSETALRWLVNGAARMLPGSFSTQAVHGTLLGPITLEGLRYQTPDTLLEVKQASLDWRPFDLLDGQLHIERIFIEDVNIRLSASEERAPTDTTPPTGFSVPLKMQLDNAAFERIHLQLADGAEQTLDHLRLSASIDHETLTIETLELAAPQGSFAITGSVTTRDLTLDLRTAWRVQLAEFTPLAGDGTLTGNAAMLRIEQTLRAPGTARLHASLRDVWDQPTWTARLAVPGFDPRRLRADWPALVLAADVEAHGGFASPWHIDRLNLALPEPGTRLEATGRVSLDNSAFGYTLNGRWQNLGWPVQVAPQYKSRSGQLQLEGKDANYRIALDGEVEIPDFPSGRLAAKGEGNLDGLRVEQLSLHALDGELTGTGEVSWRPALRWQAELAARAVNPGARWPQWSGRLDANLTTSGSLAEAGLDMTWNVRSVQGELRGHPVEAHAELDIHNDSYRMRELVLRSAEAHLEASGELTDQWQLRWSARATDMAALWPELRGRLTASGSVSGERLKPRLQLRLAAGQAQLNTLAAGAIQGTLDVDLSEQRPSRIELDISDARVGDQALDHARLQLTGKLAEQGWLFDVSRGEQRLHLALHGGYAHPAWRGMLTAVEWVAGRAGTWSLEQPANLSLSPDALTITSTCLRADLPGEAARACVSGGWQRFGESELRAELSALPSSLAAALLPEGWRWQDIVSGQLTARIQPDLNLQLDGNVKAGPGKVTFAVQDGEPLDLDYERVDIQLGTDGRGTRLHLRAAFNAENRVEATVSLPTLNSLARPDPDQPLAGRITGRYQDMDLVSVFVPAVAEPRGLLQWNLTLGGTLGAPHLSGSGSLTEAEATLPDLGIKVTDIALNLVTTDSEHFRWEGSARSGRGTVTLNGEGSLDAKAGWPLHATVKGDEVEIVRRPGLWIVASPDLRADIQGRQITLRGTVQLPRANIEMAGLPDTAITPSPDVIIVRRPDDAPVGPSATGWRVDTEIRLVPGERVNFEGFGLSGRVKGDLLLKQSPGKAMLGTGNLSIVDGQYQAFGVDLDIEQGQLVFANSPIDNPAIDLRAVRVVEESSGVITVGLHAQGRLKYATLTLYSVPPMAESDILSYLLLGRPAGETTGTGSDADLLMAAAAAVSTSQAYVAAKRLAQSLGFEETRVTPSGLVLGKSLSSRLYITYEIALLTPTNTLQLRYRLSKTWAIKAESGEAESADLIYTIER